jgi:Zn2+/Cd2+-exporting ATPase
MVAKAIFILLGIATLGEAVFADVGVALLAILNASRIILILSKYPLNQGQTAW